ncbi:MAG: TRAP transporter substrate-binding protein DctP [Spirochaetia bacterium]|nr:TRAP transporter substrate-binding protein DctP [Spirochaetia bacterium]
MKAKTKMRTVIVLTIVSIFVLFLAVTFLLEKALFPAASFKERSHVEIDRSIDDLKVIKVSYPYPESHAFHAALNEVFIPKIKQQAGMRFQVELYPDNQLGSVDRQLLGLEHGTIEMAVIPGTQMEKYSSLTLFNIPYLFSEYAELSKFLDRRKNQNILENELASFGIKYLEWGFEGYRHIVKSYPSRTYFSDALVGVSSIETAAGNSFFEAEGLIPQTYDKEVLIGYLRDGSLPFAELSSSQFLNNNLNQSVQQIPYPRYLTVPNFLLINNDFWRNISSQEKLLIEEALEETAAYGTQMVFEGEEQFTRQLDETIEPFHPDEAYFQNVLSNLDLDQYDGEDNFFHEE